jgi:transcriptional regulator with XRE-family HTH domain
LNEVFSFEGAIVRLALKAAVLQSGQTQRQIARAADIAESRFSSIVNGWVNPSDPERIRIARLLGVPSNVLFDAGSTIEFRSVTR